MVHAQLLVFRRRFDAGKEFQLHQQLARTFRLGVRNRSCDPGVTSSQRRIELRCTGGETLPVVGRQRRAAFSGAQQSILSQCMRIARQALAACGALQMQPDAFVGALLALRQRTVAVVEAFVS